MPTTFPVPAVGGNGAVHRPVYRRHAESRGLPSTTRPRLAGDIAAGCGTTIMQLLDIRLPGAEESSAGT